MKKGIVIVLIAVVLMATPVFAAKKSNKGRLTVGAKVSVYNPPKSSATTLLVEVTARYKVSNTFTSEFSVGYTTYKSGGSTTTLMPIQLNGEVHPMGRTYFDPYLGAGTGVYLELVDDKLGATIGLQTYGGLEFRPTKGIGLNLQLKYIITDINDLDSGGFSIGGGIEGNWETYL